MHDRHPGRQHQLPSLWDSLLQFQKSAKMGIRFGPAKFGTEFVPAALVSSFGRQFWPAVLASSFGLQFWPAVSGFLLANLRLRRLPEMERKPVQSRCQKRSQNDPNRCATIQKQSKHMRKSFANGSLKSNQMQAQNRPKNVPKSSQNGSKIGPKSVPNGLRNRLRFQDRFGTDFGPILAPTWGRLGGQNRAMLGPCWPKY